MRMCTDTMFACGFVCMYTYKQYIHISIYTWTSNLNRVEEELPDFAESILRCSLDLSQLLDSMLAASSQLAIGSILITY